MSPEIMAAIVAHLSTEEGTRRIFVVEEYERTDARGTACYVHSLTSLNFEARDFVAEREIEVLIDQRRENEDVADAAAGRVLIAELRSKWDEEERAERRWG